MIDTAVVQRWDSEFITMGIHDLCNIINAASVMDISDLLKLACNQTVNVSSMLLVGGGARAPRAWGSKQRACGCCV
jgi:hypothetical protein